MNTDHNHHALVDYSEYERALIRAPIVTILFLALWGLAVYAMQASLHIDIFGVVADKPQRDGADADDNPESDVGKFRALSARQIILSSIALIGTFIWCLVVWCGVLRGGIEGAVFAFYLVVPLTIIILPAGGCSVKKTCFLCGPTLLRVFRPSLQTDAAVPFMEVFLADALTSLSKVFHDCGTVLAVLLSRLAYGHDRTNIHQSPMAKRLFHSIQFSLSTCLRIFPSVWLLPPLLASLPYILRLRQLLHSYRYGKESQRRFHLLNAIKYLLNFPPIWLLDKATRSWNVVPYFTPSFILHCAVLSSVGSFSWDIMMDWGLGRSSSRRHCGLREFLLFRGTGVYYAAVFLNLVLRLWPPLCNLTSLPSSATKSGIDFKFLVEVMEVVRRSVWSVFRIEWECIQSLVSAERSSNHAGEDHSKELERILLTA